MVMTKVEYTLAGIGGLGCIYGFIITIVFSRLLVGQHTVSNVITKWGFICILSFTITIMYFTGFFVYKWQNKIIHENYFYDNLWAFLWNFGQISCYILFFKRFICTFRDTNNYKLSNNVVYIIWIFIGFYCLMQVSLVPIMVDHLFELITDGEHRRGYWYDAAYAFGIWLSNLLITLTILILFVVRLRYVLYILLIISEKQY